VSGEDKLELEKLLASGVAQVRVVLRALALRQMGAALQRRQGWFG
jgi:hypothetical protein